jgi:cold shock CspA family protein
MRLKTISVSLGALLVAAVLFVAPHSFAAETTASQGALTAGADDATFEAAAEAAQAANAGDPGDKASDFFQPNEFFTAGEVVVLQDRYWTQGTVEWFNEAKGFGFIRYLADQIPAPGVGPPPVEHVFFHWRDIVSDRAFKVLAGGTRVVFHLAQGPKGLIARRVHKA